MRRSGLAENTHGLGAHDHACWRYEEAREFHAHVREFLSDGLARGYRVWYTASGDVTALAGDLRGIDGIDEALASGAAQVSSLDTQYPVGAPIDPAAQVRAYAEATQEALAAGFTGLRVAADCTPLVGTPEQLDAFARYEHLVDHYMTSSPLSGMCGYASDAVDEQAFGQVACMHPNTNSPSPGFRLYAAGDDGTALGGETDLVPGELFSLALVRAGLRPRDGRIVLEAGGLEFLDHNSLLRLAGHAADRDALLVLRTSWPGAARLVDLLDLTNVRVEAAS
ncbi:MEDS domain-containing protein [Lentzea pudingi]|uniref:MEDS domain-containing protein n=1 Tax=Lentzea pudingi TaxID=1789439 RepID=UPI00166431AB|nr:MEDS domain-containing protein [Lentzea pudingi]